MRILHTSDWHLGKRLFKLDRFEEHERFLAWLISKIQEKKIDLLLITGDIFDTPTPPHQSLEVFYNFLHRVSLETTADTYIIAGNHDSGLLLEAPSRLLSFHRVKIWGKLSQKIEDHWIKVNKGEETLEICAIPFFRSYELLPQGEGDALTALSRYLEKEKSYPQLLMMHHLAGIYEAAGSEQVISLSGVDSIPMDSFKNFDYVALGHIHKPQKVGAKSYYSGSPIPLRFSETHPKSVVLIEQIKNEIKIEIESIPLSRALILVKADETNWKSKIENLEVKSELTPMVEVQLTLASPEAGLIDKIKTVISEKGYELLSYIPFYSGEEKKEKRHDRIFELSPIELFEEFYAIKYPDAPEIPAELKSDFAALLEKVKHAPASN